jgi:pilus assembly protein CpaB
VAIVLGLAAAKLTINLIAKSRAATASGAPMVKVVVAKRDIPPGQTIGAEDLALGQIPAGVGTEETFGDLSALNGRVLTAQIVKGQAIVRPLLAPQDSGSGLQVLIPGGMRAITLEVNEFSGLAGLLFPGCHVDLIATLQRDGQSEALAKTIVQNVKVSAVGQRLGIGGSGAKQEENAPPSRSVTLLVTPQEAEAIQLSCTSGRPWLVLRSNGDDAAVETTGVSLKQLRNVATTAQATADGDVFASELPATRPANVFGMTVVEPPAPRTVQLIRAGVESSVVMELTPQK